MATRTKMKQIKRTMQNVDDLVHIFTGKRLKNVVGTGINLFGEDLARKARRLFSGPEEEELAENNPYRILGINPDAPDFLVRAAFRAAAREYHPDTGTKPDPAKFSKALEAYTLITDDRKRKSAD